jgi:hypothetical protein
MKCLTGFKGYTLNEKFEAISEWLLECVCIFLPDIFQVSIAKKESPGIITAYRGAIEFWVETEIFSNQNQLEPFQPEGGR